MFIAQVPTPALPALLIGTARQRQDLTDDLIEALAKHLAQPYALHLIIQPRILDADIGRQPTFAP
ncbi:hypothetical protein D3C86_2261320 [compost metagenome]